MNVTRNAIAAFVLLVFCSAYGLVATTIDLFPGQESEAFSPRTLPISLAIAGVLLTLVEMLKSLRRQDSGDVPWKGFDWLRASLLFATMIGYGALFEPLGFLPATVLFLTAGIAILGERRPIVLLVLPLAFASGFWLLITRLLGLYLAPGSLLSG